MKKVFIASAIAMSMAAGSAMASQQAEIQFLGVVTETTCDITSTVDGNVNSVVQLGTVQKGQEGQDKNIVLKAKDAAACTGLTGKIATIQFVGDLGDNGLNNTNGSAKNATVKLKTVNGKDTLVQEVKKGSNSVTFDAEKVTTDGYQFKAKLVSATNGGTAGTFDSALAYAVTYN
ncbi:TPA: fimbrial protein [Escherichia coli]|uniref:Fimbrial protein n=2 Tax=Enterobacteriaceae TaxID=543 RepID=A0A828LWW1_ECOLX|nr:fimbrial protein [Escherichia coli]EBK6141336.1 fimbrial protein [Salmonella enterica]ECG9131270.1 fimbrial protein [Salmonella enterica subsp. enterica serovar 4,[5],12:i:-]HAE2645434.1 fimbrial protein [Salmonella enterica subsp. enterica serovar Enteritidis]EAC1501190.1 fimbrial protein [Escherichia coli]EBO3892227.1 fimbrial protein [Salmonella enterica]